MNRILTAIIASIFAICSFAGDKIASSPEPTSSQNGQVVLRKRTDNKMPRIPSNNPAFQILCEYDGINCLYIFPDVESDWVLNISSITENSTYYVSSSELQDGILIGTLSEFTITLFREPNETYLGEFHRE